MKKHILMILISFLALSTSLIARADITVNNECSMGFAFTAENVGGDKCGLHVASCTAKAHEHCSIAAQSGCTYSVQEAVNPGSTCQVDGNSSVLFANVGFFGACTCKK